MQLTVACPEGISGANEICFAGWQDKNDSLSPEAIQLSFQQGER